MGSPRRAPLQEQATLDDPLVGSTLADTYRVEAILADGGMSRLYRATHVRLNLTVAVKVGHVSRSHRPGSAERAEREARALARLHRDRGTAPRPLTLRRMRTTPRYVGSMPRSATTRGR